MKQRAQVTGNITIPAAAGSNSITTGTGDDSVTLSGAETGGTIDLGSGTDSLTLGDFANSLTATGIETITGGTAADVITVDNTSQTMTGGGGADTFIFATTFGNTEITDFTSGDDSIHINQSIFADFDALLLATTDDVNGHAVITADPGNTLTLNVSKTALQSGDFHFVV